MVRGVDAGSSTTDTATRTVSIASAPPPPPPPPPGGGAAVVGFVLWNAQTDTVIDSDFRSGDRISLTDHGTCLAIEVVGNAYLQPSGSPGSVQMALDGSPASCSQPGLSHENSAPFAWELDSGPGSFECATSLTAVGSHTLTATPWDADNCGASSGLPVSVSCEVLSGSLSGAPPPAAIGTPGQPFVVLD